MMSLNNADIMRLSATMRDARDAARLLLGDSFKERMAEGGRKLEALAKEHGITVLQAALRTGKTYEEENNDMAVMMIMAAVVEYLEPSE
jgi:hypothetical protein